MNKLLCLSIGLLSVVPISAGQGIPKELWGKWVVRRELPTTTISCWGEPDAKKIIGTRIEYSGEIFRWNAITTNSPIAETKTITAQQFHDENSGGSVNSSQVNFQQLGIRGDTTTQVTIHHGDAHIAAATNEIPGDQILVKDPDTIVFSVCNTYFEAKRAREKR